MSKRQDKKMRKYVRTSAQLMRQEMLGEIENRVRHVLKPKPTWMPAWFYKRLANLVINQEKDL